jgi:hypothetical protein
MARWVCALILALTIGAASLASAQPDSAGSDASHQTTLALEALDAGDVERALSILRPLARAGEPSARHNLGVLFARGLGVNQDYIAAESLFQMAAEQGYPPSFYSLGIMYAQGEGVPPDLIEAYKWFTLAKRKLQETAGHWSARMISLEEIQQGIDFLSSYLTPEELQLAITRADEWPERTWIQQLAHPRLEEVKSVRDYYHLCQSYSARHVGVRELYSAIAEEEIEGGTDLLLCVTFIEVARMMMACDGRDPILGEILHYMKFLVDDDSIAQLSPYAAVPTALIIGNYCEPSQPITDQQQELFAEFRQSYLAKRIK